MIKKIAILGGSGFIGSRLSQRLVKMNINFIIIDKIKSIQFPEKWQFADVTQSSTLDKTLAGVDIIINLAAEHQDNVEPKSLYYDVNVQGAKNVCAAAERLNIQHIIFTSSVAVYGFVEHETAEDGAYRPFNDYGKSKLAAEQVYDEWAAKNSSRTLVMVRPTVVFGEGNRGNVYNLFRQIASGKFLMVGGGNNKKSMAYVENIAAFLQYVITLSPDRYVFNYIDKPDFTMNELTDIIYQALDKQKNNFRVPYNIGLFAGYCFDLLAKVTKRKYPISRIRVKKFCARTQFRSDSIKQHDFKAPVSLEEGIIKTMRSEFIK
ncbi:NAD-dependent epimerase/dehydratase family protein [Candidatus Fukatsuia symbiotica]|uniref:UDP-N-acetylglucosamine 4-epimerase n=1 Tax=Candidatus Fukatsuia symbiotica TaxID=1878942 RepID=A0A2U8I2P7_9GAMM|nr:NAD-dependent epimerase/dehydratase family protein [Candidatus Fukatsuia symbiotica]AWK13387.1 UDP-N-acetylglucosamine 4-epimerase [Candidatus Fukatsuia symbiotica]MEA9444278.1 NAD-dependent epimerase/dehydratase family protein [Candidatus Fukatsuia symbiotica]